MDRIRRQLVCLAASLPMFVGIYYLAYWLRFDGVIDPGHWEVFLATLPSVLIIKCLTFNWLRVYQGWNRHVTFHDLFLLVQAATASSVLLALSDYLLFPYQAVPRSVFLMDWGATIVCVGGLRAVLRLFYEGGNMPSRPWPPMKAITKCDRQSANTCSRNSVSARRNRI